MPSLWLDVRRREKNGQHIGSGHTDVQRLDDTPWRNEELSSGDERMLRLKNSDLENENDAAGRERKGEKKKL